MNVLIVSNGDLGETEVLKQEIDSKNFDVVIVSDGGLRHMDQLGITPDYIVGDLDSVEKCVLERFKAQKIDVRQYSTDKDKTDTHIAVDLAVELGASSVTMMGALGTRWDHSYANVMLLVRLAKTSIEGTILNNHNRIWVTDSIKKFDGFSGSTISLLPLGFDTVVGRVEGLKYDLIDLPLKMDFPIGVSNIITAHEVVIEVLSGWLLAIIATD